VLIDPQARDVVRIAAVTEVAEVKAIEESSMVVKRPRTQRVIEQSQPGIEIYEGSIITLVSVNPRRPIACLRALLRIIIAGIDALGFFFGISCARERGEKRNKAATNSKPNGLIPARLFMAVLPTVCELHFPPGFGVTHDFFFPAKCDSIKSSIQ